MAYKRHKRGVTNYYLYNVSNDCFYVIDGIISECNFKLLPRRDFVANLFFPSLYFCSYEDQYFQKLTNGDCHLNPMGGLWQIAEKLIANDICAIDTTWVPCYRYQNDEIAGMMWEKAIRPSWWDVLFRRIEYIRQI